MNDTGERLMDILEAEFPEAESVFADAADYGTRWRVAINLGNRRRYGVIMEGPDSIVGAIKMMREWVDEQVSTS